MNIPSNRLDRLYFRYQSEFEEKALKVLRSGNYILGPEVTAFEKEFAAFNGAKFCVGVASGLDALTMSLRILEIGAGDEVIVQGNTFIASVMAITKNGATPVFAEPLDNYCIDPDDIEKKITEKTKAILVTHLYGLVTPMERITSICKRYGLKLVEDCAQAHEAEYRGKKVGTFGDVGCFSFYPTKNLGAFGDGGAVILNDDHLANQFQIVRNYGMTEKNNAVLIGVNSRLDELQASLLRVKLTHIDEITQEKKLLAKKYSEEINNRKILLPKPEPDTSPVWHQYVIKCNERNELKEYLSRKGIETDIHYPIPPHLSPAYKNLNIAEDILPVTKKLSDTVLSLPIFTGLTNKEQNYIIKTINSF